MSAAEAAMDVPAFDGSGTSRVLRATDRGHRPPVDLIDIARG
jgi:hypothetical protein